MIRSLQFEESGRHFIYSEPTLFICTHRDHSYIIAALQLAISTGPGNGYSGSCQLVILTTAPWFNSRSIIIPNRTTKSALPSHNRRCCRRCRGRCRWCSYRGSSRTYCRGSWRRRGRCSGFGFMSWVRCRCGYAKKRIESIQNDESNHCCDAFLSALNQWGS